MGLFKPTWQSDDKDVVLNYIGKLNDPEKLKEIVHTAPHKQSDGVRGCALVAAAQKLGDDALLYRIATDPDQHPQWDNPYYDVRHRAVAAIRNQMLLAKLFSEYKENGGTLYPAKIPSILLFEMITDPTAIVEVLLHLTPAFRVKFNERIDKKLNNLTDDLLFTFAQRCNSFEMVQRAAYAAAKKGSCFCDITFLNNLRDMLTLGAEDYQAGFKEHDIEYYRNLRLDEQCLEQRKALALQLADYMKTNDNAAKVFWRYIKQYADTKTKRKTVENYDGYKDEYWYERRGGYTKVFVSGGLGMSFPNKPQSV